MSKLIVRDKNNKIIQTVENGKIVDHDYAEKHLDMLSRFFGLDKPSDDSGAA